MDDLLTPQEVSEKLKISVAKVHELCRHGKLTCVQVNKRVRRFAAKHIEAFVQTQTVGPCQNERVSVARRATNVLPSTAEKRGITEASPGTDEADPQQLRKEIRSLCRW
jgi:hypothetical protein